MIVLIPAWNEEAALPATIRSVTAQTRLPDTIVVIADNCTDRTAEVARAAGCQVWVTSGNTHKKAGALNQVLERLLPEGSGMLADDAVLVMDADTVIEPQFIERTLAALVPGVGGVSSVFQGRDSQTLLGYFQRMEYQRYKRQVRRRGTAYVLTGTATLFSVAALRSVRAARGSVLPEGSGAYDTYSLTEDHEITLALLTLGWGCPVPGPVSETDVMETLPDLYHQRNRWYLGALRNLSNYGRQMPMALRWVYWRQQIGLLLAAAGTIAYFILLGLQFALGSPPRFTLIWSVPLMIASVERTVTVWPLGWKARLLAAPVVIEWAYSLALLVVFLKATGDFLRGHKGTWAHT